MNCFKVFAFIWQIFLRLYGTCLSSAGSGIIIKGLFYCFIAKVVTKTVNYASPLKVSKKREEQLFGHIFMNYIIPGSVMIFAGYITYRCAKLKLPYLFANFLLVALLTASNNFGEYIKTKKLSLYAYFNRITSSFDDEELLDGTIQTENALQVTVLFATIFLMFYSCLADKREKRELEQSV